MYALKIKGKLYSNIPDGGVMCATCKGRSVGSGFEGERVINGVDVMYSPIGDK